MKLRFLIIGHTHEDFDRCFRNLSKKLREKINYALAYLMRAFMVSHLFLS